MSECRTSSPTVASTCKKHRCPVNGKEYTQVSEKNLLHQINAPWSWVIKRQAYYYCADPAREVVYFGQDDTVIDTMAVKTKKGNDSGLQDALICYCFGISYTEAIEKPALKQFVIDKTKKHMCACEVRHPSGQCCLKHFPT
ncbi:MAG: hypothetical protein AAES65_07310 [Candidatus Thiodiazotropha sp. (ex. Lucinoma kazani)]